jgi:glutamyl-tRNA synthetase
LNLSKSEIEERIERGDPYVIRMLVPHGQTEFKDIIHGKVVFNHNVIDD